MKKQNLFKQIRLLLIALLCLMTATAQTLAQSITGTVNDQFGEPILGASVLVKGTTNGCVTDLDGNFSLSGVQNGQTLSISFIGYVTQEVTVDGRAHYEVTLNENSELLEDVVVVGYGVQKKSNLTGRTAPSATSISRCKARLPACR